LSRWWSSTSTRSASKGPILIEPKPKEPTKHQYDFDVATCYSFLQRYDLLKDVALNIEQNHAILAGHSFQHEVALAEALGILGSLDINRGDDLLGWDTDQFAMNVPELALMFHELLKGGGFTTGGLNFDAKIRRQSIDSARPDPCPCRSMDACARALLAAADYARCRGAHGAARRAICGVGRPGRARHPRGGSARSPTLLTGRLLTDWIRSLVRDVRNIWNPWSTDYV